MKEHPEIRSDKIEKRSNALQNELIIFVDQIIIVTVVIYLFRPHMATLNFDEKSA